VCLIVDLPFGSQVNCENGKAAMALCSKCGVDYQESLCAKCVTECNGIVFNEVLAYCQAFLRNFNVKEVADAVERLFPEDDVVTARKLLVDTCGDIIPPASAINEVKYRRTTGSRPASQANACDVVAALYEITSNELCPKFAVLDLSKMPVVKPMTGGDDRNERILRLEKYLERLEKRIDATDTKVEAVQNGRAPARSYAAVSSPSMPTTSFPAPAAASLFPAQPPAAASVPQVSRSSQQPLNRPTVQLGQLASAESSSGGAGGWQRRREDIVAERRRQRRAQGLQGKATDSAIKGRTGGPNRDFWISNVDKEIKDEDLRTFIENGGSSKQGSVEIRFWEKRYKEYFDTKCFRLTIGKSDYDRVYSEEFWPEDIHIRKYWVGNQVDQSENKQNNDKDE
jgi:hypothetical protein